MTEQPGLMRRLLRRQSTQNHNAPDPHGGRNPPVPALLAAPAQLGVMSENILITQGHSEAHELGRTFLEIAENGFIEDYEQLLADHVVYLVSGRSHMAGLHQGKDAVLTALATPPAHDVTVVNCVPTELMATGSRAIAVARIDGHIHGASFNMEVAFHLQCAHGLIVAITEYSSDQYLADRLVAPSNTQRQALGNATPDQLPRGGS